MLTQPPQTYRPLFFLTFTLTILALCVLHAVDVTLARAAVASTQPSGVAATSPVATIQQKLRDVPPVDVPDPEKFLNDLKLSPFWKVEKTRTGDFEAHARAIGPAGPFAETDHRFLFEQSFTPNAQLPTDWRIDNHRFTEGPDFTSLSARIVFNQPNASVLGFVRDDGTVSLPVYNPFSEGNDLGPNALSELALKISAKHPLYLLIGEQGNDPHRAATFAKIQPLLQQAIAVAKLPDKYRVREQYAPFFQRLFPEPPQDVILKRLPGLQDRDTFYGYFRTKPGVSYEGVNIKVSHPIYAGGEATRESARLAKTEYLGKPYLDDDCLFFLIEDNAIYLMPQYDKDYGTFSGKKTFDGKIEILNADKKVLHETTEPFKGWEL